MIIKILSANGSLLYSTFMVKYHSRYLLFKRTMLACILCFLSLYAGVLSGQQPYYPSSTWETRSPAQVGLVDAKIDSAVALALRSETQVERDLRVANFKAYAREPGYQILGPMKERGGPAGVIIKDGYIVAKWNDVDRVDMTFSVTKSYLSTLAGIALRDELIRDINDPVISYVWDGLYDSPHNARVTWKHLLQQSSDWSGCLHGVCDWADRPPKEGTIDDWKNRPLLEPGYQYEYNDTRVNVLAYSLLQVFRKPLPVVLKEEIMDLIGASSTWRWYGYDDAWVNIDGVMMQSVSGGGHFGGGLFINTLDHARFGLLMARGGTWDKRQIITKEWIKAATTPASTHTAYGYLWWLNTDNRYPGASKRVYSANGFGGNYIIVDEENDLVIVLRWMDDQRVADITRLIFEAILP